jgi:hypothetical protein
MVRQSRPAPTRLLEADVPLVLDPRHGMHAPTRATPARRPDSVRRTSSVDILRPEGMDGPVHLVGHARDLRTASDGTASVLRAASSATVVDYVNGGLVTAVVTDPPIPGTAELVGARAASGFRTRLDEALPGERAARAPIFLLLDDIPVTTLISGHVLGAERGPAHYRDIPGRAPEVLMGKADLCAGWREGGTIMLQLRTTGSSPAVTGPEAPDIADDDPIGWHPMAPLPPSAMRRRRRLDVIGSGEEVWLDAMFRDTYVTPEGIETIIHEYEITASVERATRTILALECMPRVLPWQECPVAAASGSRLVGADLGRVRSLVRGEFTGISTCTHLNDALRALEDAAALVLDLS